MSNGHRASALSSSPGFLTAFELQKQFVEPLLRAVGLPIRSSTSFSTTFGRWQQRYWLAERWSLPAHHPTCRGQVTPLICRLSRIQVAPSSSWTPNCARMSGCFVTWKISLSTQTGPMAGGCTQSPLRGSEVLLLVPWRSRGTYPRRLASQLRRSYQVTVLRTSFHKHSEDGWDSRCMTGCNRQPSPCSHSLHRHWQ